VQRVFPNLTFDAPLALLQAPNDNDRWFVVQRNGQVLWFDATDNNTSLAETFIDIGPIDSSGEGGLLGMAFHPDFQTNGQVFLSYTVTGPDANTPLVSQIARFTSLDGGRTAYPASLEFVLSQGQPFTNHNGGQIAFGPDRFLYIGFGDGGSADDPQDNAQNTRNWLGALLRIDINISPYRIPPDNPFASGSGGLAEIYAYGLRNPWRWSFDREGGTLWLGDVGQSDREEVNIIQKGGNYGWRCFEGNNEHISGETCPASGFVFPVAEYGRDEGSSITGGYVYRGRVLPGLKGVYLFGDFGSGTIWGLFPAGEGQFERRELVDTNLNITSFGESNDGELYVLDIVDGGMYQLLQNEPASNSK
jgi:glucose/arabinose dehydrogenase